VNNYSLLIKEKKQLKGVPKDIILKAKLEAKKRKKNGWCFTLDFPSYLPLIQFADDRNIRKKIYHAYATKASEFSDLGTDNTSNINHILINKKKLASLLGFTNYASMALKTKMANSSQEVIKFLKELSSKAKPLVKRYKFIKGFDEGNLDFVSTKKNEYNCDQILLLLNYRLR